MALTIKISLTACQSQELTRPDVLSPLNILENFDSVKAITPSILIRFSKFWCLNISHHFLGPMDLLHCLVKVFHY